MLHWASRAVREARIGEEGEPVVEQREGEDESGVEQVRMRYGQLRRERGADGRDSIGRTRRMKN